MGFAKSLAGAFMLVACACSADLAYEQARDHNRTYAAMEGASCAIWAAAGVITLWRRND
jgi:hypothetical protein